MSWVAYFTKLLSVARIVVVIFSVVFFVIISSSRDRVEMIVE